MKAGTQLPHPEHTERVNNNLMSVLEVFDPENADLQVLERNGRNELKATSFYSEAQIAISRNLRAEMTRQQLSGNQTGETLSTLLTNASSYGAAKVMDACLALSLVEELPVEASVEVATVRAAMDDYLKAAKGDYSGAKLSHGRDASREYGRLSKSLDALAAKVGHEAIKERLLIELRPAILDAMQAKGWKLSSDSIAASLNTQGFSGWVERLDVGTGALLRCADDLVYLIDPNASVADDLPESPTLPAATAPDPTTPASPASPPLPDIHIHISPVNNNSPVFNNNAEPGAKGGLEVPTETGAYEIDDEPPLSDMVQSIRPLPILKKHADNDRRAVRLDPLHFVNVGNENSRGASKEEISTPPDASSMISIIPLEVQEVTDDQQNEPIIVGNDRRPERVAERKATTAPGSTADEAPRKYFRSYLSDKNIGMRKLLSQGSGVVYSIDKACVRHNVNSTEIADPDNTQRVIRYDDYGNREEKEMAGFYVGPYRQAPYTEINHHGRGAEAGHLTINRPARAAG